MQLGIVNLEQGVPLSMLTDRLLTQERNLDGRESHAAERWLDS